MSYLNASGRKLIRAAIAGTSALILLGGHNFGAPPTGGGGGGPLSVQDFSRDKIVYDSGAAVGLASATIPVFGVGPVGDVIEGRAVSTEDNGASTTPWTTLGTVSGAGTYAGTVIVPLERSYFKIETRIQSAPATTALTPKVFAVGHVFAGWNQSEAARGWDTSFNDTAIPALVTLKQQIQNLKNPGMSGRTSRATLKVVGVDALPSGATVSGDIITLTGTGTLKDWYISDKRVDVASGASWVVEENLFEEVTENVIPNYQLYVRLNGFALARHNTFQGKGFATSLATAIKTEENNSAYGKVNVFRNRFLDLPADGVKTVAGFVRWNYMYWRKNLDVIPSVWNSGTTYSAGDHVWNSTGHAYVSKANGNLNNQPPAGKVLGDPDWTLVDPHVDCITVEKSFERVDIEYNYLDMADGIAANGGVGMNNFVRAQPNNTGAGHLSKTYIRFNVCDKDASAGSFPFQVTNDFLGDIEFYGNWLFPTGGGATNYPFSTAQAVRITWAGARHIDTDAFFSTPANATPISFIDESTDNIVQHIFNNRLPSPGSGSVVQKFMTAADRFTVAFAAMANVSLMELLGYKVVWLHHSVSGTGFSETFNDAASGRSNIDEAALHAFATADGASVGLAFSSWYASNTSIKNDYVEAIYELFTGRNWTTDAVLSKPLSYPTTGPAYVANHFWADYYSSTQTRWCILGPHSRMAAEDMTNSTIKADASRQFTMENYARYRVNIKARTQDARVSGHILPHGLEPMNWETGYLSNGAITDWLHPAADTIDGLGQFLSLLAHGAMQAAGLRKWVVPEFDQVFWDPAGAYVEVWSTAGDITTTRLQRGLASIGTTHPHWTDCFAWEWKVGSPNWNGDSALVPINDAIVVAADGSGTPTSSGRIRISKPSGTWASGDTVAFGGGAGTGQIQHPDDGNARCWLNLPIVMVGAYGADGNQVGMSVRPAASFTRP